MTVHLNRAIERLKKLILKLGAEVETALRQAITSFTNRDLSLAEKVVDHDIAIDQMEVETEEECLKILALHHPVAIDLRFVIAVLKINNDLERIADQAVNIAERAKVLAVKERVEAPGILLQMVELAQRMLSKSLDALVNLNPELAREVILTDDEVDEMNRRMFEIIQERICQTPDKVEQMINVLSVSRQLERVADQVTNIAEDVIYMVDGVIVRHRLEPPFHSGSGNG